MTEHRQRLKRTPPKAKRPLPRPHADLLWDSFCELANALSNVPTTKFPPFHRLLVGCALGEREIEDCRDEVLALLTPEK